jgi:hypothetical protein
MTTPSPPLPPPTKKEKELKRNLQIVEDVYSGHFDEYFEQHPPEEALREALGEERYNKLVAILGEKRDNDDHQHLHE